MVRRHVGSPIVPSPITRSSRIRQASCPGATAWAGSCELESECPRGDLTGRAGQHRGVVAQAHALHRVRRAVQPGLLRARTRVVASASRGTDRYGGRGRVLGQHVERLGSGDVEAAALADRVLVLALVAGRARGRRDRRSGPVARAAAPPPWRRRKPRPPRPATKQRSWLSRLSATGRPASRASARTASLVRLPSGNESRAQLGGVEPGEHVALVLARIGCRADQRPVVVVGDARVVPGGEPGGAQVAGQFEHRVEADVAVAAHARIGRAALGVAVEEIVDHLGPEARRAGRASRAACPIPWARARAPDTACGEQQQRSPSVPGSDHSSSVTATTSSPASSASWAAAALSTPPLMATSVRRDCGSSRGAPAASCGAERAVQRVGRQRRRRGAWAGSVRRAPPPRRPA